MKPINYLMKTICKQISQLVHLGMQFLITVLNFSTTDGSMWGGCGEIIILPACCWEIKKKKIHLFSLPMFLVSFYSLVRLLLHFVWKAKCIWLSNMLTKWYTGYTRGSIILQLYEIFMCKQKYVFADQLSLHKKPSMSVKTCLKLL